MRFCRILLAVVALALLSGPAWSQGVLGAGPSAVSCVDDENFDYFTPRITDLELGAGVSTGCAEALALSPESRIGVSAAPWNDLERRIDRLTLMPGSADGAQPLFVVTGTEQNLILGARSGLGDFSIGGYFAYPRESGGFNDTWRDAGSYGLGAAYESDDWWVGLAYRRLGQTRLDLAQNSDARDALELSGQYQFGSGINLQGSLGYTDRSFARSNRAERDDGGWYIVGTVKIPF